ncbi:MAG: hypothetical protein Q8N26_00920 [Myxococcales bacterium]|nr:hypothetical protein [Myxococcales bacterium]
MRLLLPLVVVSLSSCMAQQWQGTWTGSATVNDGRMPTTMNGTIIVTPGSGIPASLVFAFSGSPAGVSKTWSCPAGGVSTASSTASTATIATGAACKLTVTPDDGCTYDTVFNSGEFTIQGDAMTGTGGGRLTTACTGMGSTTSDFGFTVTATQKK